MNATPAAVKQRPLRVDVKDFPLVVQTFDGQQTDEDVDFYLGELDRLYDRGQPMVCITYIREYASVLSQMQRFGAWVKNKRPLLHLNKGTALVLPSPSFRFILSSFYLIVTPPFPMVLFATDNQAHEWVRKKLRQEGMPVPSWLG
jgi:hypothetical protein